MGAVKIVGYADRFSVAVGEPICFMVTSDLPQYHVEIVRLIHGDPNPEGPGIVEEAIETTVNGEYVGRVQTYPLGSYATFADGPNLTGSFTLQAWVLATMPDKQGGQGLLTQWSGPDNSGAALVIDEQGLLVLWLANPGSAAQRVSSGVPLRPSYWYFVAASYDAASGQVTLMQRPYPFWERDQTSATVRQQIAPGFQGGGDMPFLIGAWSSGAAHPTGFYNGKIEAPSVFGAALDDDALESLWRGTAATALGQPLLAAWDFSREIPTRNVRDASANGRDGVVVNVPTRAMTGHTYRGDAQRWVDAPEQYGAISFHDDDMDDAGWPVDFELTVPDSMRSGVYAAKLTVDGDEDYVPFFVRPRDRKASAKILWLVPTNSYLAYANFHELDDPEIRTSIAPDFDYPVRPQDVYVVEQQLNSLYDHHNDGTGVAYSSRLRPILNIRPKVDLTLLGEGHGYPHQFNADLHLVYWLHQMGYEYDVATDEDLQQEGVGLLSQYNVVLTGSHHEYWTTEGLDYLEQYQQQGGRFMYLAGNGLYWVTAFVPDRPHNVEIRRWGGTQSWTASPGEYYLSATGELGGMWRERRRAPQKYVGVGFTAQGFDISKPFIRQPASFDPRASFIFEGIGADEPIGGFGLVMNGASGFELDRADPSLGTPPHALVVASSHGFSDSYQRVIEEVPQANSKQGGTVDPLVKGDMVFYETPNGGAVFSVGSISYCGSLPYNNADNNLSRLTANVLNRFMQDGPLS